MSYLKMFMVASVFMLSSMSVHAWRYTGSKAAVHLEIRNSRGVIVCSKYGTDPTLKPVAKKCPSGSFTEHLFGSKWDKIGDPQTVHIGTGKSIDLDLDLCQGYDVNDKTYRAMGYLAKPAKYKSVKDPKFGSRIKRITDSSKSPANIIKTMYSTVQAWNADESLMILFHHGDGHHLYQGKAPYAWIRKLPIRPRDIEQVYWDSDNADRLVYPDKNNNLLAYRVSRNRSYLIRNFDDVVACKASGITAGGDLQMTPQGGNIIGLRCGSTVGFRYNKGSGIRFMEYQPGRNAPVVFPSGKYSYHDGTILKRSMKHHRYLNIHSGIEHSNLGQLKDGSDAYFSVVFNSVGGQCGVGSLVTHNPKDGSCRVVVGPSTGYPYPPSSTHISAGSYKNPGWVVLSSVGESEDKQGLLHQALYLANTDPDDPKVCIIAHHRSNGKRANSALSEPYFAEPHPVLSPSGTRVLFSSDWNNSGSVDVYVIELPVRRKKLRSGKQVLH